MLKIALALIATVATGSFASAADLHGVHLSYGCQDTAGHFLTISLAQPGSADVIEQGHTMTLTQVAGTDDTYQIVIPCQSEGFARCGALQTFELQLSPELVNAEIHGTAAFAGAEYTCRMNLM